MGVPLRPVGKPEPGNKARFQSVKPQSHQLAPAASCSICYRKLQPQESRLRALSCHVADVTGVGGNPRVRPGQR